MHIFVSKLIIKLQSPYRYRLSLSLSLSHTHTHTHISYLRRYIYFLSFFVILALKLSTKSFP